MTIKPKQIKNIFLLLTSFLSTGCLYSVHHFNTGTILPAGKSQVTLGAGQETLWKCQHSQPDSISHVCRENESKYGNETISNSEIFTGSLNYRLGIRDSWGPFPGAELEWHLELPTNPATMEFALNLALPGGHTFHHKIGAGWGIGAWADNSFFMEYALSQSWGSTLGFGNLRATYLATQIGEVTSGNFSDPLPSNQHLLLQAGMGVFYRLPDWIIIPDFIIPQVNLTLPQIPSGNQQFSAKDIPLAQWNINLGLGWNF